MNAMVLERGRDSLRLTELPTPVPELGQVLLRVRACAVCRTDLHVIDQELDSPKLPLILGHEIIGVVTGVPWLGWTCGECSFCQTGRENLCERARFTGYTLDGGYADYTVADERFCFPVPPILNDAEAAPLLCAGLVGYRCLVKAGNAKRIGIFGFGAAAHLLTQVARAQGREIYAFTRRGDTERQTFAKSLGAVWAGDSDTAPPQLLDAAIIFAPVGELMVSALRATAKGGVVVCGGIHMSDIPSFPYDKLWEERSIRSVANLTREDGQEFLPLAARLGIQAQVQTFPLKQANEALERLRAGKIEGAAVLLPSP